MLLSRFETRLNIPLHRSIDTAHRIAQAPRSVTVKGMFFISHAAAVGHKWPQVERKLFSPPREGRYVPFSDYPLADYYRIVFEGAAAAFPHLPLSEACRQAARHHMQVFASSTVGRVMLSMITDVRSALLALPEMFARGSNGILVKAKEEGDSVLIEMHNVGGVQDCSTIGTLEGCVIHYGGTPTMDVELITNNCAQYLISWS